MFKAWLCNGVEYKAGDFVAATESSVVTAVWEDYVPQIVITMTDSYGDGWNNAAIMIYKDGALTEEIATIESGMKGELVIVYDFSSEYTFFWSPGSYDSECSFVISVNGEEKYSLSAGSGAPEGEDPFLVLEKQEAVEINGASVSLGKDLSMTYFVTFNDHTLISMINREIYNETINLESLFEHIATLTHKQLIYFIRPFVAKDTITAVNFFEKFHYDFDSLFAVTLQAYIFT